MMTPAQLRSLLLRLDGASADALESETLDFKSWIDVADARDRQIRELRETVVCFANARGGLIILGVADRKRTRREAIHGVGDLEVRTVRRAIYDGTSPHILVEVDDLIEPEGRLLVIRVPRGLPPHTTSEGLAKIRVGKECKPLTGPELGRLVASGGQFDPTAESLAGSSLADLDDDTIGLIRRTLATEGQKPELATLPTEQMLGNLGLLAHGELTFAAVLLAGSFAALARWAPSHEVIFVRYRGAVRYDVRHDLRGPLLAVLDSLQRFFEAHLLVTPVQSGLFGEIQVPDLTGWAAREAVLNALVHRDYFLRQSTYVEVHSKKVVVASPGGFIGGVSPENVLRHPPVRRNPLLASACQALGLVNRAGMGVDRLYFDLLRLGKGMPRYEADEATVRLTLPTATHEAFAAFVANEERERRRLELDDLIVLRSAADRGEVDRWTAAQALQLAEGEAAERLVSLRERGFLQPRGRGRGTVYCLARQLSDLLRGTIATDDQLVIDREAARLRIVKVLAERGKLTNADIRRLTGYGRAEVLRLMSRLREAGEVTLEGRGRGSVYRPTGVTPRRGG